MGRSKSAAKDVNAIQLARPGSLDLVCFSHLRWSWVYQRPQHLLTRFARAHRVFYVEEPVVEAGESKLVVKIDDTGVMVAIPHLSNVLNREESRSVHKDLIDRLFFDYQIEQTILWYYTPMAVDYTRHLKSCLVVYDCMDDLTAFNGAPISMGVLEEELLGRADLVFTGGQSLYEAKQAKHPRVLLFPSSVDREHFARARMPVPDPPDQAMIPHPRLGYFGVIDERVDFGLIEAIADSRPNWHLVFVGPTAKVDKENLPKRSNIHYLGQKKYEELPNYLAGWEVALLPFAQNQSTRYISPTKTPEYLAGGRPVVSTPIRDVVRPYGELGLVWVADTVAQFIRAVEAVLDLNGNRLHWLTRIDEFLAKNSWDNTWAKMDEAIESAVEEKEGLLPVEINSLPLLTTPEANLSPIALERQQPRSYRTSGQMFDFLIVGAGFAGSILAERLACGSGKKVLIIDRRPHIAGNAYDHHDESGLLVHKYGPHIFHTNSREVFTYLSRFTQWRPYEHRVRASVDGQLVPIPINLDTINHLYGLNLSAFELEEFFASIAEPKEDIRTSEDVVVNKIGRQLYEKFFRNYTRKQWGLDPSELDSSVTSRVPIRLNRDDRYFTDTFQSMPLHGFTRMFENVLDNPNIKIMLNTDYRDIIDFISYREMIYTGPVDEYFDFCYGKLPYRSLQFKFETLDKAFHQPVAVINYPNEHLYTRVTEFKHLTGQEHHKTSLVYEYPCSDGDPYYPIPRPENAKLYRKYRALAETVSGVHFAGRLATYKYYNMDQVAAQALTLYAKISGVRKSESINAYTNSQFSIEMPCPLSLSSEVNWQGD